MSTRIEIELTSSAADGSWTWRAAGAREPRGVLDGSILPPGSSVGDQLRVETEKDIDGIRVLAVVPGKEKAARTDVIELLPAEERFEPVVQQRASRGRDDGPRRPRRDRPGGDDRGDRRRERPDRGERREGEPSGRRGGERTGDRERRPGGDDRRHHRPHFTPPPEVPQRPKPKRLRPGKQHRTQVLEALPDEQRPIAELAQQGIAAVRQRLREDNARLQAEGKPPMPEGAVMRMAENLIPRLRVADWLDRAEAAQRQLDHLDLRDLRSVVAASDDPVVARDESTRELATTLKAALLTKQEEELALWLGDVEAALDVGRVVRALRLSSVPPKAGVPFPHALAVRLGEATTASLQPTDGPDRWSAVLEAAAFSPVRSLVSPAAPAEQRSDELLATVRRLSPLLPQVAALFDVEVAPGAPVPKPLRPNPRRPDAKKAAPRPPRPPSPRPGPDSGDESRPAVAAEATGSEPADSGDVSRPAVAAEATGNEPADSGDVSRPAVAAEPTGNEPADSGDVSRPAVAAEPTGNEPADSGDVSRPAVAAEPTGNEPADSGDVSRPAVAAEPTGNEPADSGDVSRPAVAAEPTENEPADSGDVSRPAVAAEPTGNEPADSDDVSRPDVAAEPTGNEPADSDDESRPDVAAEATENEPAGDQPA